MVTSRGWLWYANKKDFPRSLNGTSDRLITAPLLFSPLSQVPSMSTDTGGLDLLTPHHHDRTDDRTDDDANPHDIHVHFPGSMGPTIPVSHTNLYYSSLSDNSFPDDLSPLASYPYSLQADLNYILVSELQSQQSPTFLHDSPQLIPKQLYSTQDHPSADPSSDHDVYHSSPSSSSSISYVSTLQDASCVSSNLVTRFALPPSPQKSSGYAHTMLPPIVQSNPADLARNDTDVSPFLFHIFHPTYAAVGPCGQQTHKRRSVFSGRPLCCCIFARSTWRCKVEHVFRSPIRTASWAHQVQDAGQGQRFQRRLEFSAWRHSNRLSRKGRGRQRGPANLCPVRLFLSFHQSPQCSDLTYHIPYFAGTRTIPSSH